MSGGTPEHGRLAVAFGAERRRARPQGIRYSSARMERPTPLPPDLPERLARFGDRLARVDGLIAAVVFGSVARGEATAWSDVDLAVLCKGPLPLDERLSLQADAAQQFGREADVVDLRAAPLVARGRIVRDGRELAVRDREAWNAFVTRATLDWLDYQPAWRRGIAIELELLRTGSGS